METVLSNNIETFRTTNICRCCLGENSCFKNLSSEYYDSGIKEVYEAVIKDTFNLQISQHHGMSYLICEVCIVRLREASRFKEIILHSECRLNEYIEKSCGNETGLGLQCKTEIDDFPTEYGYSDGDLHNDGSFDDDVLLSNLKAEVNEDNDDRGHKRKRPKKCTQQSNINDHFADRRKEKDWLKLLERRGNGPLLRGNSLKLIKNSTMCVFQWNKSRYRCFCCEEPFSDMKLLRDHTNTRHTLKNIEKKIISQQNKLVKVEVSFLFCKICKASLDSLDGLRSHLEGCHAIKFELKEDLLVPFKIGIESAFDTLQCQLCSEKFTVFRLLNIHMNKHFQKQVCHICGAGFSNAIFLSLHRTRLHRLFVCKSCDVSFKSRTEKRQHDIEVHNLRFERKFRFPCPYCQERFFQENFRVQHLVDKHGMAKPEFKCSRCPKVFITKSLCNNHIKGVHLREKNHECDVCHLLFYSKSDVARHKVTHTGEKNFSCTLCNNPFASKDSLRRHMKRTHVGVQ